jgi:hypothetical protein
MEQSFMVWNFPLLCHVSTQKSFTFWIFSIIWTQLNKELFQQDRSTHCTGPVNTAHPLYTSQILRTTRGENSGSSLFLSLLPTTQDTVITWKILMHLVSFQFNTGKPTTIAIFFLYSRHSKWVREESTKKKIQYLLFFLVLLGFELKPHLQHIFLCLFLETGFHFMPRPTWTGILLFYTSCSSWNDRCVPPHPVIGWDGGSLTFCPSWLRITIIPISASQVAKTT